MGDAAEDKTGDTLPAPRSHEEGHWHMSVAFQRTEEYEIHDHDAGRHQCSQQHPPTSGHTGFPSFPVFTFMMNSHISNSNAAATSHNPRNKPEILQHRDSQSAVVPPSATGVRATV